MTYSPDKSGKINLDDIPMSRTFIGFLEEGLFRTYLPKAYIALESQLK